MPTSVEDISARVLAREQDKRRREGLPVPASQPARQKLESAQGGHEKDSEEEDREIALALVSKISTKPFLQQLLAEQSKREKE